MKQVPKVHGTEYVFRKEPRGRDTLVRAKV